MKPRPSQQSRGPRPTTTLHWPSACQTDRLEHMTKTKVREPDDATIIFAAVRSNKVQHRSPGDQPCPLSDRWVCRAVCATPDPIPLEYCTRNLPFTFMIPEGCEDNTDVPTVACVIAIKNSGPRRSSVCGALEWTIGRAQKHRLAFPLASASRLACACLATPCAQASGAPSAAAWLRTVRTAE